MPDAAVPTRIATRPARPQRRWRWAVGGLVLLVGAALVGRWMFERPVGFDLPQQVVADAPGAPGAPGVAGARVDTLAGTAEVPASAVATAAVPPSVPAVATPTEPAPAVAVAGVADAPEGPGSPSASPASAAAPRAAPASAALAATPRASAARTAPPAPVKRGVAPGPASPRAACGERTQFSLYRCMQTQCAQPAWVRHPQCERLRTTDTVE